MRATRTRVGAGMPSTTDTGDGSRPFPILMVGVSVLALALALGVQVAFCDNGAHSSLSDIPRVFVHRGIGPGAFPYVQRVVEYPVGAGLLLYLAAVIAPSPVGVLMLTGLMSAGLCVAITVVLERRCGARAWRWALGTPLLLLAFQNWDVFAIAAMLAGLFAFERHRDRLAGAALAVGAAVKLFPAILVLPLVALRWSHGDRRGARRLAGASAVTFLALNLPFLLVNVSGWWWPVAFQSRRDATWGSAWLWVYRILGVPVHGPTGADVANLVGLVALVVGLGWLTVVTVRRNLAPVAVAGAGVAIFVLANKVYSPQYDVWLLAFFVLLPFSRRLFVAFCAVDLAVYLTVTGYFHGLDSRAFLETVLPVLVLARTIILVRMIVVATRPAREIDVRSHGERYAQERALR